MEIMLSLNESTVGAGDQFTTINRTILDGHARYAI
jgi:hypothetical protein